MFKEQTIVTVIGGEFTVSGLVGTHEVCSHYHGSEADIAVISPDQTPEWQSEIELNTVS